MNGRLVAAQYFARSFEARARALGTVATIYATRATNPTLGYATREHYQNAAQEYARDAAHLGHFALRLRDVCGGAQ